MEEKTYKLLGGSGALNIAVGAVVLVSGIASGVLLIVNGARQLAHRGKACERKTDDPCVGEYGGSGQASGQMGFCDRECADRADSPA